MSAFDGQADLLATLIASTATFQSVTGKATPASAKDQIGLPAAYDEEIEGQKPIPYPRAIVTDGGTVERECVGTATWRGIGSLFLAFEFEAPADKLTEKTQRAWFLGKVSTIMREAEVLSDSRATPAGYTSSHLVVKRYRRSAGPLAVAQSDREQSESAALAPLWAIEFEVEY